MDMLDLGRVAPGLLAASVRDYGRRRGQVPICGWDWSGQVGGFRLASLRYTVYYNRCRIADARAIARDASSPEILRYKGNDLLARGGQGRGSCALGGASDA